MRLVHFADLHLDSQFAWAGAYGDAARRRRQALRDTLSNIVKLVHETQADALVCGGDLYEHERFTPDTAAFLKSTFADLRPIPVYLAPGNHDWYGPKSLYELVDWTDNVHIFRESTLDPVELVDGLTLWGAAHCAPANTDNFLSGFRVERGGVNIALFHGAEQSWLNAQGSGKAPHAPFDAQQIVEAGLDHVFLGHYHRPRDAERHTYPGNPDPLEFGEDGERGAVVADIQPDGSVRRKRRRVAVTAAHDLSVDVTGRTTQQIIEQLRAQVDGLSGAIRVTVRGDIEFGAELRESDLRDILGNFDACQLRVDIRPAFDFDAIRQERSVRGLFVRSVDAAGLDQNEARRVITTGLRALEGRGDLEVL